MWGFLADLIIGILKWLVSEVRRPAAMEVGPKAGDLEKRLIEKLRRDGWLRTKTKKTA